MVRAEVTVYVAPVERACARWATLVRHVTCSAPRCAICAGTALKAPATASAATLAHHVNSSAAAVGGERVPRLVSARVTKGTTVSHAKASVQGVLRILAMETASAPQQGRAGAR